MLSILLAGGVALTVTLLGTPLFIRFLVAKQYGQFRTARPATRSSAARRRWAAS